MMDSQMARLLLWMVLVVAVIGSLLTALQGPGFAPHTEVPCTCQTTGTPNQLPVAGPIPGQ